MSPTETNRKLHATVTMALIQRCYNPTQAVAAFFAVFDVNKGRMHVIAATLKEISKFTQQRKDHLQNQAPTLSGGVVVLGLAAGVIMGLLTGSLSLAAVATIAGLVVGANGWANIFKQDEMYDQKTMAEVKQLIDEFVELVIPLKKVLHDMKCFYKGLNKDSENLVRVETCMENFFGTVKKFSSENTTKRLVEVSEQCERTLKALELLQVTFYM